MTESVRVLHVLSSLSTYGAERIVADLVPLLRQDLDAAVMTMYTPPRLPVNYAAPVFDVGRRRTDRTGAFFRRMIRIIRGFRPAIVHTHVHNGKYWGRLAAIAAGVPAIVHTEHNSEFSVRHLVGPVNRLLHARTARVVAFSPEHAARVCRAEGLAPNKVAIIANGVALPAATLDRARARERLSSGERALVACVGRFERVKNQRLAIEAVAQSAWLRRHARLVFVGDGIEEPEVRAYARERGLTDEVTFLGYQPNVADVLVAADALLITSLNEAMPLAALEAMFCGVPIVAVPWAGSEDLFEAGRLAAIAPSYAPSDVASALEETLCDREVATGRARNASETAAREYTLTACARRHTQLYRSLLA